MNVDRLQPLGHGSGRDLALHAAARLLDERGDQLAGICQAHRRVLAQADPAAALGAPRPELTDRDWGDRRLFLGGADRLALAHGGDRVEVHRQRRVQRVIRFVGVLDARDAEIGGVVARIEHDAGDRLLADGGDQLLRERRELLGDQEGIAAAAHIQHPLVVQVELGLEAVVAAEHLHRQPCRHDLGDGGRDERLIRVLGDQLFALGVDHEHEPRRRHRRDLLLGAGEGRCGQQEQSECKQARRHGDSSAGATFCDLWAYASDTQGLSRSESHNFRL